MLKVPPLALVTSLLLVLPALSEAQTQTGTTWQHEPVWSHTSTCPDGINLVGFDHDPGGRPVLAWQEPCRSGAPTRVFWARKTGDQWDAYEYIARLRGVSVSDSVHRMLVAPGDGTPFLVFMAPGAFNEYNTYRANLEQSLSGWEPSYLESIAGPQTCPIPNYALAAAPTATADTGLQWATGRVQCNGFGTVSVNGTEITGTVEQPLVALAVAPDGGRHLVWSSGTRVYYSRRLPGMVAFETRLLLDGFGAGGADVRLVADASGGLHALMSRYQPDSGVDLGTLVYVQSLDRGDTWTPPSFVDPYDAIPANPGIHTDISLAVDAAGLPAVTYWKARQQLWFSRRDATGSWTRSQVATRPNVDLPRAAQVDFDWENNPVIAYYDQPTNRLMLARPVPTGVVVPVDLALTGRVSPAATAPGGVLTYTFTVTNQGTTGVTSPTLEVQLPAGVTVISAAPAPTSGTTWALPRLAAGASTTVTVSAAAPATAGDVVLTAAASSREAEGDPSDNAVVLGAVVRAEACFVPTTSLAALFRGDRTAENEVANQPDGAATAGVSYTPGVIGDAFQFDGVSGAVVAPQVDDAVLYPGSGSFTVQAWVRTSNALPSVIAARNECQAGACGPTVWLFQLNAGVPVVFLRNASGSAHTLTGTRPIHDGAFHHVGFVIDRAVGELRLYIDGARDATMPYTLEDLSDGNGITTPLVIGAIETSSGARDRFFAGAIDELSIARRAYSDAEIAQIAAIASAPGCAVLPAAGSDADVAAAITATPAETALSGPLQYVVRATNVGGGTASGVTLRHTLPAGAVLVGSVPASTTAGAGVATFTIGALAPGASTWAVVRATAPSMPGPAVSTADVSSVSDGNPANDLASATVVVTRGACTLVPAGLAARWRADGTVLDATGTVHALARGLVDYLPGRQGAGLAFALSGTGYLEVADAPALRSPAFTLSAWVSPEFADPSATPAVLAKGSSGTGEMPVGAFSYWLGFADGLPTFTVWQPSGPVVLEGPSVPQGDWYHLAATVDGTTARLYLNGEEVASRALSAPVTYDASPLRIGDADSPNGIHRFSGLIDDVTLHARALSIDEIRALEAGPSAECLANRPPVLVPPSDQQHDETAAVVLHLEATDADADPLTFAVSGLPPGLAVDPHSGLITGFAMQGTYQVTVRVTDGIAVAESGFAWTVTGNRPPTLAVTRSGVVDTEGDAVDRVLASLVTAVDPDGDLVTISLAGLPPGLALEAATGHLRGTLPAGTAGTYTVIVTATDARGGTSQADFRWRVNARPVVSDPGARAGAEGESVNLAIVATDGDGDALVFGATGLPPGLAINAASGVISGTLGWTSSGRHVVRVTASDGMASGSREFVWDVLEVNDPPSTNTPAELLSYEDEFIVRELRASDPDGDPVTLSVVGLPTWLLVEQRSPNVVRVSGTPPRGSAGAYPYTVTVSDGRATVTLAVVWRVDAANLPPIAVDDVVQTGGTTVQFDPLANDSDPEGSVLTLVSVGQPASGLAALLPGSRLSYTPSPAITPPYDDAFTYVVRDADARTATGRVTVHVLSNAADLSVAVTGEPPSRRLGQSLVYRVRVRNLSLQPASSAQLRVTLPTSLTVAAMVPPPSSSGATPTWQFSSLAPGAIVDVVISLGNPLLTTGAFDVRATVTGPVEASVANNTAVGTVRVASDACFVSDVGLMTRLTFDAPNAARDLISGGPVQVPASAAGYVRDAAHFAGDTGGVAYVRTPTDAFTVAAWARAERFTTGEPPFTTRFSPVLSQRRDATYPYTYWLGFDNGRPALLVTHVDRTFTAVTGSVAATVGEWHHLAATAGNGTVRLYLDGVLAAEAPADLPIFRVRATYEYESSPEAFKPLAIGAGARDQWSSMFVGDIDEVSVHGRALSAAEIRAMVDGPADGCVAATVPALSLSAVAVPSATVVDGAVTYALSVTNASNGHVAGVRLTHDVPEGSTFLDATMAPSETTGTRRVFDIGLMAPGQAATVLVRTKAPPFDASYVSTASVGPADADDGDNHATVPLLVQPQVCVLPAAGLIGQWRGEGSAVDSVAGTIASYPYAVYTADARAGRAFVGPIHVADAAPYRSPAFTVAGWFNVATWRGARWDIAAWNGERLWIGLDDGYPAVRTLHDGVGAQVTRAATRMPVGRWVLLAASFDGSRVRLFINGSLAAEANVGAPLVPEDPSSPLVFGERPAVPSQGTSALDGWLDELALWNRALSDEEMLALFEGSPGTCAVNQRPTLVNPGPQSGVVGVPVQINLQPSDPEHAPVTVRATGLPDGLTLDPATGVIAGVVTPEGSGRHTVVVTVSDGRLETSESFEWNVLHQLTVTVGRGVVLQIDGVTCDAAAAETTCSWNIADGTPVVPTSTATFGPTIARWEENGVAIGTAFTVPALHQSRRLRHVRLAPFLVTVEGYFFPDLASQLVGATAVDAQGRAVGPIPLSCSLGSCTGAAPLYATVAIQVFGGVASTFQSFGGDCQAGPCTFTANRSDVAVTVVFSRRLVPITVTAGPHAVAVVRNVSAGTDQTCAAGDAAVQCAFDVPYGAAVEFTSATPAWPTWLASRRDQAGNFPSVADVAIRFTATAPETLRLVLTSEVTVLVRDLRFNPLDSGTPVNAECTLPSQGAPPVTQCRTRLLSFEPWVLHTMNEFADGVLEGSACGIDGRCQVRPDQPQVTVDVAFRYRLSLTVGLGGRVNAGGTVCDGRLAEVTCLVSTPPGLVLPLQATDDGQGYLARWSRSDLGPFFGSSLAVTMNAPKVYAVTFIASFTVRRSVAAGTVRVQLPDSPYTALTGPVDDVWTGAAPVGSSVVLSAEPAAGARFLGWSGDCVGAGDCTLTISRNRLAAVARFNRPPIPGLDLHLTTPAATPVSIAIPGTDPDGDPLTAELVGGGTPASVGRVDRTGPMSFRFTPAPGYQGLAVFFYYLSDGVFTTEHRGVYVDVLAPRNTPVGSSVTVTAFGSVPGVSPPRITFESVTVAGHTTFGPASPLAPPEGFRFASLVPPIDIETTASYTAPVRTCLVYPLGAFANPAAVRIFHFEGGAWADRTVSVNPLTGDVCALVSSLSPFALAEPVPTAGMLWGAGRLVAADRSYEFALEAASLADGTALATLKVRLTGPTRAGKGVEPMSFRLTDVRAVTMWDDPQVAGPVPAGRPDSVVVLGSGEWNGTRGYTISVLAVDGGDPGRDRDRFAFQICDQTGSVVAAADGPLRSGQIEGRRSKTKVPAR